MSVYDDITQSNQLQKGDHLARIESTDLRVAKSSGNEYLSLKLKLKSGETLYHNLYFSQGALPMTIKQLKNLKIVGSLPIYDSIQSLMGDQVNFIRKTHELLMGLEKKKITVKVLGYDENDRVRTWIEKYSDVENHAVQREVSSQPKPQTSDMPAFDSDETIPF